MTIYKEKNTNLRESDVLNDIFKKLYISITITTLFKLIKYLILLTCPFFNVISYVGHVCLSGK